ncbi:hypothetical protein ACFQFQ_27710 [Sulfitobacter porphyrae]|uniref:TRAP C4-dicarboxylate transport system permease DctM subunit domain-containing protein n=1 Tax=Sulfitobacter porphyrae TaxID=1246864 RepID=A0ABW2BA48_9RHOB
MEPVILVMLSLVAIFALIMLHVPVGIAMTVVGVVSFGLLANFKAAFSLLASEPASIFGTVDIAVIPLFLLMGSFANAGGWLTISTAWPRPLWGAGVAAWPWQR